LSSAEPARPLARDDLTVKLVRGIGEIAPEAWDACVPPEQPFARHAFLQALEASGSACGETGWLPLHLAVEQGQQLLAVAPLYMKSHSYGEYVFDWGWANAYERAGGRYYPKLQLAVPFTPVPGPRLLVRPDAPQAREVLIQGLLSAAHQLEVSSLHVTFCTEAEWAALGRAGLMQRSGVQYHWLNRGYRDFQDFLDACRSSRRKTMRKERLRVREQGVEIEVLSGAEITPGLWDTFYPFYLKTVDKRWGNAYLTKRFFQQLGESMAGHIVLVMARHQGRYVGGALNLKGGGALYGRVWGCRKDFDFLHFEACYYAAIEYAILNRLDRVEAGAQGQHKLQRGYEPVPTYSAHWIRDPGFKDAVSRFLVQERREMAREREQQKELLPYRQTAET